MPMGLSQPSLLAGGWRQRRTYASKIASRVLVPDEWKGASANGVNKTFVPSTNLKQK
jgi:hypothetical protein